MNATVTIYNNALAVSWYIPVPMTMTTEYTLTLTNILTSVPTVAVLRNDTQSYQFDLSRRETCYEFHLRIAATHIAGSNKNVNISGRFPVLPNTISHQVKEVNSNVNLEVTFNV